MVRTGTSKQIPQILPTRSSLKNPSGNYLATFGKAFHVVLQELAIPLQSQDTKTTLKETHRLGLQQMSASTRKGQLSWNRENCREIIVNTPLLMLNGLNMLLVQAFL